MKNIWNPIKIWTPRIALLIGILLSGSMLSFAYVDWRANEAMINEGLKTHGIILNKEYLSPYTRGPSPMHITAQYQINTLTYTHRFRVSSGSYDAVVVGEPAWLYYAKDDPYRIAIAYDGVRSELREEALAQAIIGVGILLFLSFGLIVVLLP